MSLFLEEQADFNYRQLNFLKRYLRSEHAFIAGGVFKNLLNREKAKDVDVYFEDEYAFNRHQEYFEQNEDFVFYYENDNVICFLETETKMKVELIKKHFGTAEEVVNKFDFTIAKAYFQLDQNDPFGESAMFGYHERFFEHLHMKRLVVDENLFFPVSTFNRIVRYAKYGYAPCFETRVKVVDEIRNSAPNGESNGADFYDGFD